MCNCSGTGRQVNIIGSGIVQLIPCRCSLDYDHSTDPKWLALLERLGIPNEHDTRKAKQSTHGELLPTS